MIPLFFPLLALIAGIVSASYLDSRSVWLCLPLASLLGFARRPLMLLPLFLLGAGLRSLEHPVMDLPPGTEASRVVGQLRARPDWRGIGVYLDVDLESVDGLALNGRARLTEFLDNPELLDLFRAHHLGSGDRLEVVVRLRRPATYRDPGVFDFRRHLEREGVFWTGTIRNPRLITVVSRGSQIQKAADRLLDYVEGRLDRQFSGDAPVQGLVAGMVLGRKHDIPAEVERLFQAGGLYHLVVVSGFNLAVVAGAVAWFARFLFAGRVPRLLVAAGAALGYALLVGQQPPVLRAVLMVFIMLAARLLDRDYGPLNALALAAFILLVIDPRSLEDASFQMTFAAAAAVAGIGAPGAGWAFSRLRERLLDIGNAERDGLLSPEAADWRVAVRMFCELHRIPLWIAMLPWRVFWVIAEGLLMTLSVELVFAGFMVESFHRLSPISPLLNVPAGLAAAAITVLGLVSIVLPGLLGQLVAWSARLLVSGLLFLVRGGVSLPYSSVRVPSAPSWFWLLYVFVGCAVFWGIRRKHRRLVFLGIAGFAAAHAALLWADFSPTPPRSVTATFLDVGQGDSSLVEFPDGRRVLIDGGGVSAGRFLGLRDESTFSVGEDVVSAYLFSRGFRTLDVVVLTHAHNDHMEGLFDVLENFTVGELWVGRNPLIPAYRKLLETARRRGTRIREVSAGMRLGEMTVLHPPPDWHVRKAADNNDSVVLLLRAGAQTALFTGDLERPLADPAFVNLLKVAHHGSRGVRMRVKSDVRVISVGANNPFGHPHPSSLPALRTDQLGAIEVRLEGSHPRVRLP